MIVACQETFERYFKKYFHFMKHCDILNLGGGKVFIMNIGEKIKNRRTELRLTLDDVARIAGVGKATICRYEKGDIVNIPSDRIERIAKALKCTPAFLMGWEEHPTDTTKLMALYDRLNDEGKRKLLDYADDLVQSKKYTEHDISEVV